MMMIQQLRIILMFALIFIAIAPLEGKSGAHKNTLDTNGYIVFINNSYDAIEVILYFNNSGKQQIVGSSYIPGGHSASFPTGNAHYSAYSFSTSKNQYIQGVYSEEINLY